MEAAQLLAAVRTGAGLTQAELARRAGTSQAMVARYETGAANPTMATLRRLLRAAGHDLVLASRPTRGSVYGDLSGPAAAVLRQHRTAIRRHAARLGVRNIRVYGSAVRGGDTATRVHLLVDFPVARQGFMDLVRLAGRVEDLTGLRVTVMALGMLRPDAASRALAEAMPL